MGATTPESPNLIFHCTTAAGLLALIIVFSVGAGLRSYIAPPNTVELPLRKQLAASLPVGMLTMPLYAKNTFPALVGTSPTLAFDLFTLVGYVMVAGMLSRETLDRLFKAMTQTDQPN